MIEPTDEMFRALLGRTAPHALEALLAIINRDYCTERRGHVYHPTAKPPQGCSCPPQHCYGQDVGLGRQCRSVDRLHAARVTRERDAGEVDP